jgi:hypothetical protein
MATDQFDDLLKRLPEIADVVNKFKSEAVQQSAFDALVGLLGIDTETAPPENKTRTAKKVSRKKSASRKTETQRGAASGSEQNKPKRKTAKKGSFSMVKDLNLRPKGKKGLKEFCGEKAPKTHVEKCTVSVYYLCNDLSISAVDMNHVYTCYKHMKWRLPSDLSNMLAQAGSKGYLDVTDRANITVTTHGDNLVEHDLPKEEPSK